MSYPSPAPLTPHPPRCLAPPKSPLIILVALLLSTTSLLVPSSAQEVSSLGMGGTPAMEAREDLPEDLFEQTIRAAYGALEEYTAHSGAKVEFDLTNLSTHGAEEFDRLRLIEVATMPEGRVIDVTRKSRSMVHPSGKREVSVRYEARWKTQEANWRNNPSTAAAVDLTIIEALPKLQEGEPLFKDLRAVTTYNVTVTLGGETLSYRAGFFWFNPSRNKDWDNFDLLVTDHITQGVDIALRDTVPVEGRVLPSSDVPRTEGSGQAQVSEDGNFLAPKITCQSGVVASRSVGPAGEGTNSHFTGKHIASVNFSFSCDCGSDCSQVCSPNIQNAVCDDGGLTTVCHKMQSAQDVEGSIFYGSPAACTAAFRCVQGSCLACACGLTVGVSVSGGEVTYSGDSGDWRFKAAYTMSCPTCPTEDPVDDDPDKEPVCGRSFNNTSTASVELDSGSETSRTSDLFSRSLKSRQSSRSVTFPLERVEARGDETFIMEEWAVTSGGAVVSTSNPAFAEALVNQNAAPTEGTALIVHKPVHVTNERYVPDPGVLIDVSPLPEPMRGDGELVIARVEFNPAGRAGRTEILYSSSPVNEKAIEGLFRKRVNVAFAGEKTHRSATYVAVRIKDTLQIVGTASALPQCCCSEIICV